MSAFGGMWVVREVIQDSAIGGHDSHVHHSAEMAGFGDGGWTLGRSAKAIHGSQPVLVLRPWLGGSCAYNYVTLLNKRPCICPDPSEGSGSGRENGACTSPSPSVSGSRSRQPCCRHHPAADCRMTTRCVPCLISSMSWISHRP